MSKPMIYSQERMDEALVPLPEKREVYQSFAASPSMTCRRP